VWNKIIAFLLGLIGMANIIIFLIIVPFANYDGEVTAYPKYRDALHVAMEIGRLDAISLLLTVLGILLAAMALIGFGYVESRAETHATNIADRVARDVAETVADRVAREVTAKHINTLSSNVAGLQEPSGVSKPIEAGNVDIIDVTEVERERDSNGNA